MRSFVVDHQFTVALVELDLCRSAAWLQYVNVQFAVGYARYRRSPLVTSGVNLLFVVDGILLLLINFTLGGATRLKYYTVTRLHGVQTFESSGVRSVNWCIRSSGSVGIDLKELGGGGQMWKCLKFCTGILKF